VIGLFAGLERPPSSKFWARSASWWGAAGADLSGCFAMSGRKERSIRLFGGRAGPARAALTLKRTRSGCRRFHMNLVASSYVQVGLKSVCVPYLISCNSVPSAFIA